MSLVDKLILGVCLLRPVFSVICRRDVNNVTRKYSVDSALSNCQSNLPRLTRLHVFFLKQKIGDVFMIHTVGL